MTIPFSHLHENLWVIKKVMDRIAEKTGSAFNVDAIPLDDKPTYSMLGRKPSHDIFLSLPEYATSSSEFGEFLWQFKPKTIDDIAFAMALQRPGPKQFINFVLKRRQRRIKRSDKHPVFQKLLQTTNDLPIFHEQIIAMIHVCTGFSITECEWLRHSLRTHRIAEQASYRDKFIEAAEKNYDRKTVKELFDTIDVFIPYTLQKAKILPFAVTTYRTAYLNRHYRDSYNEVFEGDSSKQKR